MSELRRVVRAVDGDRLGRDGLLDGLQAALSRAEEDDGDRLLGVRAAGEHNDLLLISHGLDSL